MASELNIAGLQKKVDLNIAQTPVFTSPSSAKQEPTGEPAAEPQEKAQEPGREPAGEQTNDGSASKPATPVETVPEKK
jgi:hypothetical protein